MFLTRVWEEKAPSTNRMCHPTEQFPPGLPDTSGRPWAKLTIPDVLCVSTRPTPPSPYPAPLAGSATMKGNRSIGYPHPPVRAERLMRP
jgi:hypothetical protein